MRLFLICINETGAQFAASVSQKKDFRMLLRSLVLTGALALSLPVLALEYPIGAPQNVAGMEVAAVYLQPAEMADAAGVTESEMEAYAEGEDIADESMGKIEAYNKDKFTSAELKYYLAIRKLLKLSFPLAQRSGKILSETVS